jgi:hypothetical protein
MNKAIEELVAAIDRIVAAWDKGDLAGAVNRARLVADKYRGQLRVPKQREKE